jgi:hypothetical protein
MSSIVPLSTSELLAFAFVCACFGVSIGIAIAGWIASRDPSTERRGTGHTTTEENPNVHHLPPANAPRLTPHERRRFRS